MNFFRPSSQKKLKNFFVSHNFEIKEGGLHTHAIHPETGEHFVFPRHNKVSSGVTNKICKRLEELGYDVSRIKKILG